MGSQRNPFPKRLHLTFNRKSKSKSSRATVILLGRLAGLPVVGECGTERTATPVFLPLTSFTTRRTVLPSGK